VKKCKWLAVLAAVAVCAGSNARAQEQPYTWDSKVVFEVDGVQKRVDIYTVRYVMGGMVQKMQISSEVDKKKVRLPNGKKLSKKDREVAREFVMEAKQQLDAYLNPLFAEKAVATAIATINNGTLRLRSNDVIKTGDSVEINLVQATRRPKTAQIKTAIGDSPVELEVGFESLDYGPIELKIITENSNYVEQKN